MKLGKLICVIAILVQLCPTAVAGEKKKRIMATFCTPTLESARTLQQYKEGRGFNQNYPFMHLEYSVNYALGSVSSRWLISFETEEEQKITVSKACKILDDDNWECADGKNSFQLREKRIYAFPFELKEDGEQVKGHMLSAPDSLAFTAIARVFPNWAHWRLCRAWKYYDRPVSGVSSWQMFVSTVLNRPRRLTTAQIKAKIKRIKELKKQLGEADELKKSKGEKSPAKGDQGQPKKNKRS